MSFIENNQNEVWSMVFSIIYLIKSLRNNNIKNVEYSESVDYADNNFENKIYSNGDLIYIKNWETWEEKLKKKYNKNQKWKIIKFYDDEGLFSYEIEPYYNQRGLFNSIDKEIITFDRILSYKEELITDNIKTFREKYENKFLIIVVYLCFINCIHVIKNKDEKIVNTFIQNTVLFSKLLEKFVEINKTYFLNLNFNMKTTLPNIINIIKNIHINILKLFNIDYNINNIYDILKINNNDLTTKMISNIMNYTTKYKIQFVQNENYNDNKINEDLSSSLNNCSENSLFKLPSTIKINYKTPYGNNVT
jgi:hypothetical protein